MHTYLFAKFDKWGHSASCSFHQFSWLVSDLIGCGATSLNFWTSSAAWSSRVFNFLAGLEALGKMMKKDEQINGCVTWRIMEVQGLAKNSFFRFVCRKCKVTWCLLKKRSNVEHSETEILNIGWIQTPHIWLKQLSMLPVLTRGMIDKEGLQRCENGFITFWIRLFRSLLFHRILTTLYMSVTSSGTNSAAYFSVTISTSPVSSSPAALCWKTQYETDYSILLVVYL